LASYEIVGSKGKWRVHHDGKAENVYVTNESAFEAAIAAASLASRQGHEVVVKAPASLTATGAVSDGEPQTRERRYTSALKRFVKGTSKAAPQGAASLDRGHREPKVQSGFYSCSHIAPFEGGASGHEP